ncbi:Sas10 C-terminal domain-containing protein [Cyathus striatus]|nr:Sas10 C-terminal domain-containing protein [Cyathus striatus]
MPRRRSTKLRPTSGKPKSFNQADGKLKKWNTVDDIPLDDEDEFHASRDKILLEGDHRGGDNDGDEDEVFALKGIEDDDKEEDEDEGVDDFDEEEMEDVPKKKSSKPFKKSKPKRKSLSSDEEEEESEPEESWGQTKAAWYSSNADQIESDDEETNELEEQEAKRLQQKAREDLTEDDFGLNDSPETDMKDGFEDIVEPAPAVLPVLPSDKKSLLRHLEKTSPETLALARDWGDSVETLMKTKAKIEKIQAEEPDAVSLGMTHLHYQALLSYTTLLAFYFHLRASPKYAQRPDSLKSHPILQRLLTLKQSVSTLEDLDFAVTDSEDYSDEESFKESIEEEGEEEGDDDEFDEEDGMDWEAIMKDAKMVTRVDKKRHRGMDAEELADLLRDAEEAIKPPKAEKPPKKKRKSSKEEANAPVFDLEEPEFMPARKSMSHSLVDTSDTFGEASQLHQADAADKSSRKKSLRFHTSKIESTSAKRQGARNQASGGDDDIPYRERKKDREDRLAKEAKNRVKHQGGADLDDAEPVLRTAEKRRREDDSGDDDDENNAEGYYELVKKKSKEKKEQKKKEYGVAQAALRPDMDDDDSSGPRSLTRAILKNRGLTPHRSKSVRNPRVKKRQKFEKAKKTVASQRAVYKGGVSETGGRYDGEKSGISKVVKGVRLA